MDVTDFTKNEIFVQLKEPPTFLRQCIRIFSVCCVATLSGNLMASPDIGSSMPSNQPPIAEVDFITTPEDTPVTGNVLDNDHDPEGLPMVVVPESKATNHGWVEIHADGTYVYTPNANYHGQDAFDYSPCDTAVPAACCHGEAKITVLPVQDAPVAGLDSYATNEDTPLTVSASNGVLKNDSDADGESLTAILGKTTSHGTLMLNADGSFTYQPAKDFNGTDTFTYYAYDGIGKSAETLVTITVIPVNDPPIAVNDVAVTNEDMVVQIPVLANDMDVDNALSPGMIKIVTPPQHGTVTINNGTGNVVYTPAPDYFGPDSFTYKLKDPAGAESGIATVSITVNPVNDAPLAKPDFATTPEEVAILINVLANDTDVDNPMTGATIAIVSGPSHGTAIVQTPAAGILYTPDKDYNGNDTFSYTVTDVGGAVSLPGLVTVTVTPVNDAPVSLDDVASTPENTPVGIPVLVNDYDVDNSLVPSSVAIATQPLHGQVVVNPSTGVVTYTPDPNFEGTDVFTYTATDPDGLMSTPATVTVTVIHVNYPPVAVDDAIVHQTPIPITIDVLANDYDPDNTHDELTLVSVTNPSMGTVQIVAGKIVFTPEGTTSGTVTFTYTISDPDGLTDEGVVTIEYTYKQIIVSQGFSPNNDGSNDTWYIQGIENYPNNVVKVYDRWGIQVYQKAHYENTSLPWDGRANVGTLAGKLVERGTYFYIVEPGDGLAALSGYVVVVR